VPSAHRIQTGRAFGNLHGLPRAHGLHATRVAPGFSRQTFAHQTFAHHGFRRGHDFHRFRGLFGWAGPLFWPYAYDDIYDDVFWSYGYGDPFWDYGYGDIYGGIFSPFGYNDLAGYLSNAPRAGRRSRSDVTASIPSGQALSGAIAQMCGDDTKEVAGWPIDRIQQLVTPNDQQRAALDDLANASLKAAQIIKTACPTTIAFTPTGRLAAMQTRIEAMVQATETARGPLETFYNSLTDEQKARLTVANPAPRNARAGGLAQSCTAANAATQWPEAQIEKAVRPNEAQKASLNALQTATTQAAEQLAASCPAELPTTPPARLAAMAKRLDVMLQAVRNVRAALNDFYGALNDEQKAQFNLIGQPRTAQRQG
jgi:hypothetical protein